MSDHTSKRQRLTGSFSPASPPYHLAAKPSAETKLVAQPNTPTSPPYTSMNPQSHGGPPATATAPASEMTPPSSVHISQHFSPSAASASNPHPFSTPGSTTGIISSSNVDSDGDAMMADSLEDEAGRSGEHRLSNHNRQTQAVLSRGDAGSSSDGPAGGLLFNFCQSTHPVSRPHGSQNLFELYGLSDLAKSVARTDLKTGEKINKLRKSYQDHIKALQIAGKPKAIKMERSLTGPVSLPDDEYASQRVTGNDLMTALNDQGGFADETFGNLLDGAFAGMAPGPLPSSDAQRYRAYLGTDDTSKSKVGLEGPPNRSLHPVSAAPTPLNPTPGSRASRPERLGSKRSYTDISFQGYGEGFADDGYADSTGEDDGQGNIAKKRRLGFERTSHSVEVGGARR